MRVLRGTPIATRLRAGSGAAQGAGRARQREAAGHFPHPGPAVRCDHRDARVTGRQVSLKKRVSCVYQPMLFVANSHSPCSNSSFPMSCWTSKWKSGSIRSRTAL